MFEKQVYVARRQQLLAKMAAAGQQGIILFVGNVEAPVFGVPALFLAHAGNIVREESHIEQAVHRTACLFYAQQVLEYAVIGGKQGHGKVPFLPFFRADVRVEGVAAHVAAEFLVRTPVYGFSAFEAV